MFYRRLGLTTTRWQRATGWPNAQRAWLATGLKRRALDVGFTKSQAVLAWQAFKQMTPHEQQQVQLDVVRWLKRFKVELREREMAERWERILARYGR